MSLHASCFKACPTSSVQSGSDATHSGQHVALLRQLLERAAPYLKRIVDEQAHELEIERAIWEKLHPGEGNSAGIAWLVLDAASFVAHVLRFLR